MPRLIEQKEIRLDWSDIAARRYRKPKKLKRSTGVHLSGVIKYCLGLGDQDPDEMPLCVAIGLAWEEWAIGLWADMVGWPAEQCKSEVYGTPDGLTAVDDEFKSASESSQPAAMPWTHIVEEFKTTLMSMHAHGDILKETKWIWQGAGYCCMMELNHVRFHILWLAGDYRPPKARYFTYLLEYSAEELTKFWRGVVLANKDCVPMEKHD